MADQQPLSQGGGQSGRFRRIVATEIAPGFVLLGTPRPNLAPLFVEARKSSGAAFVCLATDTAPTKPIIRRLDLDAILNEPALWLDGAQACGVADFVLSRLRPIRASTHPPMLGAVLAIRGLAMGGAVIIDDAAPPQPHGGGAEELHYQAEARHGARLLVLSTVRRDLAAIPPADPAHLSCAAVVQTLIDATLRELRLWSYHRCFLCNQDMRPTWSAAQPAAS